jgi:hypothetical protein
MTDRLQKACERKFEHYVEMLFNVGETAFAACLREQADPIEIYFRLADLDGKAKQARRWFARHAPCRYQPLPLIHYGEIENIMCSSDLHRHLTVYFSYSLRRQDFDYAQHPGFYEYSRGLLADPDCPISLRADPELLQDFPPQMLPTGPLDEGVYWRPLTRVGAAADVGLTVL